MRHKVTNAMNKVKKKCEKETQTRSSCNCKIQRHILRSGSRNYVK